MITVHGSNGAAGNKISRVFKDPSKFIDLLHHLAAKFLSGFLSVTQQKDRNIFLPLMQFIKQLLSQHVLGGVIHSTAKHQTIYRFIGRQNGKTIVK